MGLERCRLTKYYNVPKNVEVLVLHLTSGDGDYAKLTEDEFVVHQLLALNAIQILLALGNLDPRIGEEDGSARHDGETMFGRHVLDVELGWRFRYLQSPGRHQDRRGRWQAPQEAGGHGGRQGRRCHGGERRRRTLVRTDN